MAGELIACETVVAATVHLRELDEDGARYSGTWADRPKRTLCGKRHGWDLPGDPMARARCRECLRLAHSEEVGGGD